jgi:hypothetical protein
VGYISCPPTTGFFIPATAEVTAMATMASTTANFLFIFLILIFLRIGFLDPHLQYGRILNLDFVFSVNLGGAGLQACVKSAAKMIRA